MKRFSIKDGYQINSQTVQPMYSVEASLEYQVSVYTIAAKIARENQPKAILDIGCGLGLKLAKYILPLSDNVSAIDTEETIKLSKEQNADIKWFSDDIERPHTDLGQTFDLIICADVIEHLENPDTLIDYMKLWASSNATIIISTPERDLRRGPEDFGPPKNESHVREWNQYEFAEYLTSLGLEVFSHDIVALRGMTDTMTCQCILGRFKN